MKGYLGEFDTEVNSEFTKNDWALWYIGQYGGFDGDHHKAWILDQVALLAVLFLKHVDLLELMRHS